MKHIKKYQPYFESIKNNWEMGSDNTKTFLYFTNEEKFYISGCKNCNEPTPLKNKFNQRQLLGNVYQSLCNCSVCDNYVVYDEHNFDDLDFFFNNKERILSEDKKNRRKGMHILITTHELGNIKPTEIVDVEDFRTYHIHLKGYDVKQLYVYAKETNSDDLMDNPYNNAYQMVSGNKWKIVLDLNKKLVYAPYPWYHYEDEFPVPVKDIFNKYIKEYCK